MIRVRVESWLMFSFFVNISMKVPTKRSAFVCV